MRRRSPSDPPHGALVDVELVHTGGPAPGDEGMSPEDTAFTPDHPSLPADHMSTPPVLASPDRRRRRRWWAGAVAVAVLAAFVVGANVAEARRADARRAALADSPGYVPSLAEPLRETWRIQGSVTGATRDALLVATAEGLQAVDPASGEVLWTHGGAGLEYCQTVGVAVDPMTGLPVKEPDGAAAALQLVACTAGVAGDGRGAHYFGPVAVQIVDATTGQVRTTLTASGALLGTIPIELDLVMVLITAEGHLRVVRWDPATGEAAFDTTTVEPVVPAGTAPGLSWYQVEDTLIVSAERLVAVSLTTGLETPADDAPADEWMVRIPMPDGAEAVWTRAQTGAGHGEVVEADGTVRFEFTEMPWWALTTDDSAPDLMVVLDDTDTYVTGLDARTGRELWTLETPSGQPTVQVDGVLVVIGPTVTMGVDVRDGRTLWSVPTAAVYASGITDGEVVVLTEAADPERLAEGQVVVARTIRDGTEVWRSPLPAGTSYLMALPGGHVIGHNSDGIFGLG